jgi:hypothetical protein
MPIKSNLVSRGAIAACIGLLPAAAMAGRPLHPGGHVGPMLPPYTGASPAVSGTWTKLTANFPGGSPDTALLMTDGTVLMHDACSSNWYRLTADASGSYVAGTWTQAAAMPTGYAPLYFASSVLPDGRLIVNGGEYNAPCNGGVWTKLGALYDPVADSWTSVTAPSGWTQVGDAASAILPNGKYMLQSVSGTLQSIGTVAPPPGTTVTWAATGTGKGDANDEEGWTSLASGEILTVDTNRSLGSNSPAELYSPTTGAWTATGTAPSVLVDPGAHEIGPAVRLPDGNVFQSGSGSCSSTSCPAHTAIYVTASGTWLAGPDFPKISGSFYDVTDGPASILPNGHVLIQASPAYACGNPYCSPSHFFDFDGTTLTQVNEPASAPKLAAYQGRMLALPSGQILWSGGSAKDVEVYTPVGHAKKAWAPVISTVSTTLTRGGTNFMVSAKRLHGVSNGAAYGDDAEMVSDYPIVRITNAASGNVCFARMHDWTKNTALFDVPAATPPAWERPCDTGAGTLQVIVNGIASVGVAVTVN